MQRNKGYCSDPDNHAILVLRVWGSSLFNSTDDEDGTTTNGYSKNDDNPYSYFFFQGTFFGLFVQNVQPLWIFTIRRAISALRVGAIAEAQNGLGFRVLGIKGLGFRVLGIIGF